MPYLRITSPQNDRIKSACHLRQRRQRDRQSRIVIDGWREVERAVSAGVVLREVFLPEGEHLTADRQDWLDQLAAAGGDVIWTKATAYQRVAFGERESGVVAIAEPPRRTLASLELPPQALVAIVEQIEKPGNLGAILRSADGAGIDAVVVADPDTDLYNPNVIRASLGTVFTVPVCSATVGETIAWLRMKTERVYVARVDGGLEYDAADYGASCAIVLGSEAAGVSVAWLDAHFTGIRLPMLGVADSLNVSATAAVLFYEARRQRSRGAER